MTCVWKVYTATHAPKRMDTCTSGAYVKVSNMYTCTGAVFGYLYFVNQNWFGRETQLRHSMGRVWQSGI